MAKSNEEMFTAIRARPDSKYQKDRVADVGDESWDVRQGARRVRA